MELPIDGEVLVGPTGGGDWSLLCEELLGFGALANDKKTLVGQRILISRLVKRIAKPLPHDVTEIQVHQYARYYILVLLGEKILMDKSGDRVHLMFLEFLRNFRDPPQYSWGSGCLTWLYRELCRESHKDHSQIGGVLQLVQYWAWAKLLFLCPKIEPPIQKKSFHYTFKGHELHTHFITIHSKGMSKSLISLHTHFITIHSKGMNYMPISLQFI